MRTVEMILDRVKYPDFTEGTLSFDGEFFCDTLEDPVRELKDLNGDGDFMDTGEGKIYGDTAIPAGRYRVVLSHSPAFDKILPLLEKVPGFTGIRMHGVRSKLGTKGCIGVGKKDQRGLLYEGKKTEDLLVENMQAYGEVDFYIQINERT